MARFGQLNFTRIFASAIARRLALLLVTLVLAWAGIGTARAADQGEAYQLCQAAKARTFAHFGPVSPNNWPRVNPSLDCAHNAAQRNYALAVWTTNTTTPRCISSPGASPSTSCSFSYTTTCAARADKTGLPWQSTVTDIRTGSVSCEDGCQAAWSSNGDGTATAFFSIVGKTCNTFDPQMCNDSPGTYWNQKINGCEPIEPETCPAGQVKNANGNCETKACPSGMVESPGGTCVNEKNECPPGNVKSPTGQCLPGEGQCAAGEARGKDGTCKRDSDGDGTPDNEDDDPDNDDKTESFSGGDNCNSPPSCSGGAVDCGMARIQWRIDCNTRRNVNITGGACTSMPICSGDKCNALEYSQLLMQWRSACAAEKLLAKDSNGNDGGGGQPEWTKVGGMNQNPGAGQGEGDTPRVHTRQSNTDDLDQSGFGGGGGSCPGFAMSVTGTYANAMMTHLASPPAFWCTFISTVKAIMILIGSVASVFIIARS
jgi:hypothetical protein